MEALTLLEDVIDIYMPDMKYSDRLIARRLSKIGNYPEINRIAVKEMHRQVGDLQIDSAGIAQRGLLIRHLVLPHDLAGTKDIVQFLANEISKDTYLNIMGQYRPAYKARDHEHLDRSLRAEEYERAVEIAQAAGLTRLDNRTRIPRIFF